MQIPKRFRENIPVESAFFYLALLGVLLLLVFLSLRVSHEMIRVGYEIETLKKDKVVLARLHKELLVEVASLNAIERIDKIATEQLQMAPALPHQRVYMKRIQPENVEQEEVLIEQ